MLLYQTFTGVTFVCLVRLFPPQLLYVVPSFVIHYLWLWRCLFIGFLHWVLLCKSSSVLSFSIFLMNTRNWNVLCWNIRGLNGSGKWDAVRDKINESACSIVCLQETKRDHFDTPFIRKFLQWCFDKFAFAPSIGASGGILVAWISNHFNGFVLETK